MQDQIIGQMFAGHETTAASMTHMLQLVRGSPKVLACMRQEQADLIAQHGPDLSGEAMVIQYTIIKAVYQRCSLSPPHRN